MFQPTTASLLTSDLYKEALASIPVDAKNKPLDKRLILPVKGQTRIEVHPSPSAYGNGGTTYRMKVQNANFPSWCKAGLTVFRNNYPLILRDGGQDEEFSQKLMRTMEEKTTKPVAITTESPFNLQLVSVYRNKQGEPTAKFDIAAPVKVQSAEDLQFMEEQTFDYRQTELTPYAKLILTQRKEAWKNKHCTSNHWPNLHDENGGLLPHLCFRGIVEYKNDYEEDTSNSTRSLTVGMLTVPKAFRESLLEHGIEFNDRIKLKLPKDKSTTVPCFAFDQSIEFELAYETLTRGSLCVFYVKPSFWGSYMSKKCLSFSLISMSIQSDTLPEAPPAPKRRRDR